MKRLVAVFILASVSLGCKKEEPNLTTTLNFHVNHTWNGQPFGFDTSSYITPGNDSIIFKRINYLLSRFEFQKSTGEWISLPDAYGYINANAGKTTFELNHVPVGNYSAIRFMIGLDTLVNHSDPNLYPPGHALDPVTNNLHWDWTQGYVFIALEGNYFVNQVKKIFSLHIAFEENQIPFSFQTDYRINKGTTVYLNFDVQEIFQNPWVYRIEEHGNFTHSTNDNGLANSLRDNIKTAIVIHKIE